MPSLRALLVAISFLTRVPVGVPARKADLDRAMAWFPAVGAVLGGRLWACAVVGGAHLRSPLLAAILVALLGLATGGLHLDGVADTFDALAGGRGDRDRMLAIMRDSRIGAAGAAALAILLGIKVLALAAVLDGHARWAIVLFPAVARFSTVLIGTLFPSARSDGLAYAFSVRPIALLPWATACLTALMMIAGKTALAPSASGIIAALMLSFVLKCRLGGVTGDVYGCAVELAETTFLVAAAAQVGNGPG